MHTRIVLVEPEYSMNVGAVCRVMKNFGYSELWLVNPKCETKSIDAYRGAKHAKDILESAKTAGSLDDALKGCDLAAGTSGIKRRNKGTIRSTIGLRAFAKSIRNHGGKKLAIIFGREGIGLNEQELNRCDLLVHIESSDEYPVLNLSHAAAVVLYSISNIPHVPGEKPASKKEFLALKKIFASISAKFERKNMRAPVAFARLISRAQMNEQEAKALLNLFRLISEKA